MTRILALETSALDCSVALADGERQVQDHRHIPQAHTRQLLGMVDGILAQNGVAKSSLDAIAFGQGPGSFTGLRICASFAQGLAFGLNIPLLPLSSLRILAQTAADEGMADKGDKLCCVFDARMDEVYYGSYIIDDAGIAQATSEELLCTPEQLQTDADRAFGRGLIYGDRITAFSNFSYQQIDLMPQAKSMLTIAQLMLQSGDAFAVEEGQPVYLRGKSAWQ